MSAIPQPSKLRLGISGLVEIIRPYNCFVTMIVAVLGAFISGPANELFTTRVIATVLVVGLAVAFSNVINDYHDAQHDQYTKASRPIPSGRIPRSAALVLSLILGLVAFVLAYSAGPVLLALAVGWIAVGISYSYYFKNIPLVGNLVIALAFGLVVVAGGLAVGTMTLKLTTACLLIILFLFNFELVHVLVDAEEDTVARVSTVAVKFGPKITLRVLQFSTTCFIVTSAIPWMWSLASPAYLVSIVLCTIIPSILAVILVSFRLNASTAQFSLNLLKVSWFFSLLPLALLR